MKLLCMMSGILFLQETFEKAIRRARELHNVSTAPPSVLPEYKLWEEHWCRYVCVCVCVCVCMCGIII